MVHRISPLDWSEQVALLELVLPVLVLVWACPLVDEEVEVEVEVDEELEDEAGVFPELLARRPVVAAGTIRPVVATRAAVVEVEVEVLEDELVVVDEPALAV